MIEEYDWDIYESFRDKIESQIIEIEENILQLQKNEVTKECVNLLFRIFHSYKATSAYLSLWPLNDLSSKVEIVLSSLRDNEMKIEISIVNWLSQVTNQLKVWLGEMYAQKTQLSKVPKSLTSQIKISRSYISVMEKLKSLEILYFDDKNERAKKVSAFLKKISKNTTLLSRVNKADKVLNEKKYDIIIMNSSTDNYVLVEYCKENYQDMPIIAIFDTMNEEYLKKSLKYGLSHVLKNPINAHLLKKELSLVVKTHFSSRNVIVNNQKISRFIKSLKPLPKTIVKIMDICNNNDTPIRELVKAVSLDPIIAANILKSANSPLYGSVELKTVEQAVIKLGKNNIKTLCFMDTQKQIPSVDLSPYGIDENKFSQISKIRLSLMLKWYSKISIADLSVLSLTALLGNLGQLLIANEIKESRQVDMFKSLSHTFGIKYAEEALMHTTTNIVSSQLLQYWKLDRNIIDILSWSDDYTQASEELKKLTLANFAVYTVIPLNGEFLNEIPEDLLKILDKYNLKPQNLQNALSSIKR